MSDNRDITRAEMIAWMGARNAVYQMLGMQLVEAVPGRSRFLTIVRPDMTNTFDTLHGGMIFTIADLTFGFTCNAANERAVTAGASIEMLNPARVGDRVLSEAIETYREGRNAVLDVRVWVEDGPLVALARGRMRVVGGPVREGR